MSNLFQPDAWLALITLTVLEIVLGIDNIIFISILSSKLPAHQQARGRQVGLVLAMGSRLLLLLSLAWIIRLQQPLFAVLGHEVSGRDLILLGGGLFLLGKSTYEIHEKLEGAHTTRTVPVTGFGSVVLQIMLLDVVFSLDSVITAVGMANQLWVMMTAVVVAVLIMLVAVNPISAFVERHPTVKMLALSFLLLIGFTLVAEGLGLHIPKGYIYFAMAFSVMVDRCRPKPLRGGRRHVGQGNALRGVRKDACRASPPERASYPWGRPAAPVIMSVRVLLASLRSLLVLAYVRRRFRPSACP